MDPKQDNKIPLIQEISSQVSELTSEQIKHLANFNHKPKIIMHYAKGINRILHVD